jgi:hypothetical protein
VVATDEEVDFVFVLLLLLLDVSEAVDCVFAEREDDDILEV